MGLRDFIRSITPGFILEGYRDRRKEAVRKELKDQKEKGQAITVTSLKADLETMGIQPGDTILVHSSMSKMGYLEDGPKTVVDALLESIGTEGNLMMPTSPNASLQKEHVQREPVFDVLNSPSRLGAVTEYFRQLPGVKRSLNATEPVAALGPQASYLTEGHFGEETPYTSKSPFTRLYEFNGKILYVGVTLDNAGTNLHTLEDAVDFPYPVYDPEIFEVTIVDEDGVSHQVKTKVHNPIWSAKRKCDGLLPMFEQAGVMTRHKLGQADVLLFDGPKMFETMVSAFNARGVTMYHPEGS